MPFDLADALRAGYRFAPHHAGVSVTAPDGTSGFGRDAEESIANIGAQIIPVPSTHPLAQQGYTGRLIVRANGEDVVMDPSLLPVVDVVAEPVPVEAAPDAE